MHVGVNLLFLAPGEMGGLEVYSRELVAALAARDDVELTLFLNRLAEPDWADMAQAVRAPIDPRRRVQWVAGDQVHSVRMARRVGVDVVHSLASTGPAVGGFARVVTVHDLHYRLYPEAHFGMRALGMRALVPLAARRAHRVIVPSDATRADLLRFVHVAEDRVDVVPEGIGQAPGTGDRGAGREWLAVDARPVALSVSAKRPHKNLARLIGALARLPAERRPLLVLPGYPTPYEAELRELAGAQGVSDDVRFLGWVSRAQLDDLYAAADLFVFPSLYEGFGLPVLEAMARGLPVATSGRASLAEVAGDAALTFDPEDEASIAAVIERMLGDERLRERLAEAGRGRAGGYTWARAAELTVESYRRALAAR
ncbi:MAG TPA: glycosyltransferase family 1 protein [Thermoleophilaceae bacterium]|nr:glycosyltransferase family 1 protein [Thermoleophilaceae bacterium]